VKGKPGVLQLKCSNKQGLLPLRLLPVKLRLSAPTCASRNSKLTVFKRSSLVRGYSTAPIFFALTRTVKVKESRNRPGVAQRVPGGLGSQISWHSAHGGEVSLTYRPPLPPGNVPGTHFHQGLSRPQGHGTVGRNMSLKNPVTPPGIDPGTVWLVAQRLNHYASPGPNMYNTHSDCRDQYLTHRQTSVTGILYITDWSGRLLSAKNYFIYYIHSSKKIFVWYNDKIKLYMYSV
jgi:hypothetical protein